MATIDELHAQSVQGDLNPLMAKIIGALRTGAEFVSPPANGPGAAAVAGIRSLLPGRGNFSQEFDRYNRAAAPSPLYSGPERFGSIVKEPGALGPSQGESEQARQMALQTAMVAAMRKPPGGGLKKYDMYGRPIPVDAETGAARGWTAEELRQKQARFDASMARARADEMKDGPFQGAAVRNMATGEVINGGPVAHHRIPLPEGHTFERYGDWVEKVGPGEKLPDLSKTWEAGFITKDGKFVARKEATSMIRNGETDLSLHASDGDTGFRSQFLDEMERTQRPVVPSAESEAAKALRGAPAQAATKRPNIPTNFTGTYKVKKSETGKIIVLQPDGEFKFFATPEEADAHIRARSKRSAQGKDAFNFSTVEWLDGLQPPGGGK